MSEMHVFYLVYRLIEEKQHSAEQQEKLAQLHLLSLEKQALLEEQERIKQLSEEQRMKELQEKQNELLMLSEQKEIAEELLLKEKLVFCYKYILTIT